MLKNKKTSATEIPQNALSHNEGKYISKFEYVKSFVAEPIFDFDERAPFAETVIPSIHL